MIKPDIDLLMELIEADDNLGLCLACGDEAYGVEPDARRYKCESCGKYAVWGCEEILISGLFNGDED